MTPRNFSLSPLQLAAWRRHVFCAFIVLLFVILAVGGPLRLSMFAESARREAALRHYYSDDLFAHRGDIVDTAGVPLALSADVYEIRADMVALAGTAHRRARLAELTPQLAEVMRIPLSQLKQKFASGGRSILLRKSLPPARAQILRRMNLFGLRIEYNSKRYYPQKEYAASVVGYTNYLNEGLAGIELARHAQLQPVDGKGSGTRARTGWRLNNTVFQPPRNGNNITLSLDSRLQFYAVEELQKAMSRHRAIGGAAAVMDARTGDILALASLPGFNPNNIRSGFDEKNKALTDAVEPGSLAKPFVAALALQTGVANQRELFPTGKSMVVGGVRLEEERIKESLNMAGILKKSSNIGAALLAHRVGKERLWSVYRLLGFGSGKMLGMPGEVSGVLRPAGQWRQSGLTTHAYGYGFSATLLQLLSGYSVFANDGMQITPRLEKRIPPSRRRVFTKTVARRVRAMLEGVVEEGGTATRAAIVGYRVAGKTGTAIKQAGGAYQAGTYRAFFIGLAPASNPRYIAAVMIDEPRRNGYGGGAVAAPVFREIMRRTLLLNAVAPDAPFDDHV